jgi:multiple sugar transport system substrate-binding protein
MSRRLLATACAAAGALPLVACGGSDDSERRPASEVVPRAEAIQPDRVSSATGQVHLCAGNEPYLQDGVRRFSQRMRSRGLSAELIALPDSTDEQRQQIVQRQRARRAECDVYYADNVWTGEFASQGWVLDLTPYVERRRGDFVASTLETTRFANRFWGVPLRTDTGFIYYRTDQIPTAPATWQELYRVARGADGLAYQGSRYEGLTVNFLDVAYAAGGRVVSEDGRRAELDSPENLRALELMVDGLRSGAVRRTVTTYDEEGARRAFESGRASAMRNWPYAYALGQDNPEVRGRFAVMPLPQFKGAGRAGVLGGYNLVVSAHADNRDGALALIDFLTSPNELERNAVQYALGPPLTRTYADPDVRRALPFASELLRGVEQARPRPVSPVYPQISQAIYTNVHDALTGKTSPQEALRRGHAQIDRALATF